MDDDIDRCEWGASKTSQEMLDDMWNMLLEKADYNEKEEIRFFLHCTTIQGKKSIMTDRTLYGGKTDLPARAPLASYYDLKGVWLAISSHDLPRRSPYGTQRMIFRVKDIFNYMGTDFKDDGDSDEDRWDAEESDQETSKSKKASKAKGKKKDKKKSRSGKRQQKDCYLRHKVPQKPKLTVPLLFFECAHFYGSNQYVRLLLVRVSDPKVEWCREHCKELDIHHNPFLQFMHGRIFTYRSGGVGRDIMIEVLLVGNIIFDKLLEPPEWDEVGTLTRAGFDFHRLVFVNGVNCRYNKNNTKDVFWNTTEPGYILVSKLCKRSMSRILMILIRLQYDIRNNNCMYNMSKYPVLRYGDMKIAEIVMCKLHVKPLHY